MLNDTRIAQMRALVDDTRALCADVQEQKSCESLARLMVYLNWSLQALEHAEKELEQ